MTSLLRLSSSPNPTLAYKARTLVLGESPDSEDLTALRRSIRTSEMSRRLLGHRKPDGTLDANPYRKWQGPHWTLYSLAQIDYPPGDSSLTPLRDQAYRWLFAPEHLRPPRTTTLPRQNNRVRRCGSQEGNAIWYSMKLGLVTDDTRRLVDRLIQFQWPDGGWNCDVSPDARTSSIIETLIPLRALCHFGRTWRHRGALQAAERASEFLLRRRLLYRLRDGRLIQPTWGGDIAKIQYPIQFYDVLFALKVMVEIGKIDDPRCADAIALLASKRLRDGGFPVELMNCTSTTRLMTRGSYADWGPAGKNRSNPFVTIDALHVLRSCPPAEARQPGCLHS